MVTKTKSSVYNVVKCPNAPSFLKMWNGSVAIDIFLIYLHTSQKIPWRSLACAMMFNEPHAINPNCEFQASSVMAWGQILI